MTHEQILALLVTKDQRIMNLELQLQLANAQAEESAKRVAGLTAEVAEWQKAHDVEKPETPPMDEDLKLILRLAQPPFNYAMGYLQDLGPEKLRELAAKLGKPGAA